MPSVKELRLRIKSLNNTKKITSAMKLVSASKLKKAKDASLRSKPYIEKINEILARVSGSQEDLSNPLLESREVKSTLIVLFSSDRGLCGAFNNSLLKFFYSQKENIGQNFDAIVVGKKAMEFLRRNDIKPIEYLEGVAAKPKYADASKISKICMEGFLSKEYDKVYMVYNQFVSTLTQTPTLHQLLPIEGEKATGEVDEETKDKSASIDYIFEPNKNEILDELLPKQVSLQVYQCLLDNAAGEHAARMTAMDNSTNNAKDMINSLTLIMNRARQAAITKELIEVVSGAESL